MYAFDFNLIEIISPHLIPYIFYRLFTCGRSENDPLGVASVVNMNVLYIDQSPTLQNPADKTRLCVLVRIR
jgi:hypothetical protein